jgi:hypothetical protein
MKNMLSSFLLADTARWMGIIVTVTIVRGGNAERSSGVLRVFSCFLYWWLW